MSVLNLPEFILFPPNDDTLPNPCLCWLPDDNVITGLYNHNRSNDVSLVNSMVQLVVQLPELNHELPLESKDVVLETFTKLVLKLHGNEIEIELVVKLQDILLEPLIKHDIKNPVSLFNNFAELLMKTRFGSRFRIDANHGNYLGLELLFSHSRPVALVELLNSTFSIPTLFTGGKLIPPQRQMPLLLQLPHFLVIAIQRHSFDGTISDTTLEVPLEMDFGKYLSKDGTKPKTMYKYRGSATFYKLHGFVTQKNGHYLTYSRVRSGNVWYKIDDESVEEQELSWQIQSKGVCMLLYRLQDQ